MSFGSRGSHSFSPPPFTATAPRSAQPLPRADAPTAGFGQTPPTTPRRFGFGSGLAAGLLGAGLFGLLTGHGLFGGIGSLASLLGMVIQIAFFGWLIMALFRMFRGRSPAYAGPVGGRPVQNAFDTSRAGPMSSDMRPLAIGPEDFTAFETTLIDLQIAYGREDLGTLSRLTAPQVYRVLESDLSRNRGRGVRNEVSQPKLLQGDLAEAWREGTDEFATVAMRFSILDVMVERATGRIVEGNAGQPTEATELWTFWRRGRGSWLVSAIQQSN